MSKNPFSSDNSFAFESTLLESFSVESELFVDLTHTLDEQTLVYPGKAGFKRIVCCNYENGYRIEDIQMPTGIGTHMDSPRHFYKELPSIDHIETSQLIAPIYLIDLADKIKENADYAISVADILDFEKQHGIIAQNTMVFAYTGWSRFWDQAKFCGLDANGACHFPGFSPEAASFLVERKIAAVGIDTMSIDYGLSTQFEAHQILLKQKIILIENLANLDKLPAQGAIAYVFPMKIRNAPEAPVRAFAKLPNKITA